MSNFAGPKIIRDSSLVFNFDAANYKSYPAGQDIAVNNVSLMLDGESLVDKSLNNLSLGASGTVTIDSSIKKVGNSSIKFGGAKTDYITISNSTVFSFPGDFTIEFWTYANQFGQQNGFSTYFSNDTLDRFQLAVYPNNANIQLYLNGSLFIQGSLSSSIVGRWMHIAVVRSGTTIKIYENGTSIVSGTSSYSIPTTLLYIGRQLPRSPIDYAGNLDGYIDDFRITKYARYTSNFTPPTSPLSLPNTSIDLTTNKAFGTLNNSCTYSSNNKGYISFSGAAIGSAGAGISIPYTSNYDLSSGDFSVESWVMISTSVNYGVIIGRWSGYGVAGNSSWALRQENSGKFQFVTTSNGTTETAVTDSSNFITNTWYHLVAVKSGSNVSLYKNGVLVAGPTAMATIYNGTANLTIGNANNQKDALTGSIATTKIYKGRALNATEVYNNYIANKGRFGL